MFFIQLRYYPLKFNPMKRMIFSLMAMLLVVSAAAQNIRSYESHVGIWFEKFETDTNLFIYSSDFGYVGLWLGPFRKNGSKHPAPQLL